MKKIFFIFMSIALLVSSVSCKKENNTDISGNNSEIISSIDNEQVSEGSENTEIADNDVPSQIEGPWVVAKVGINSYTYEDYIYDNDGKIIEIRTYNTRYSKEQPLTLTTFTYNKQDDGSTAVKILSSKTDAELCFGKEAIYDANGLCVEIRNYDDSIKAEDAFSDKKFSSSYYYEYDEEGKLIKIDFPQSISKNKYYLYTYDENDEMISYEKWSEGECYENVKFIRNDNGEIIKEIIKSRGEEYERDYTYSYDYDEDILLEKAMMEDRSTYCKITFEYNDKGQMNKFTIDANNDGYTPARFFKGDGYFVERICFPMTGNEVTFAPLSQVLAEQNK